MDQGRSKSSLSSTATQQITAVSTGQRSIPNFDEILKTVKRLCHPPIDAENLAADIVLEHLISQRPVSFIAIQNRCRDALRRLRSEQRLLQGVELRKHDNLQRSFEEQENSALLNPELDMVQHLITVADLTFSERTVLWKRFYKGQTLEQIAKDMGTAQYRISSTLYFAIEKLKTAARKDK